MTSRNHPLLSLPLPCQRSSPPSSPSAVGSSPPTAGTLDSYPVTASPFSSSPALSSASTQTRLSLSLDLFDDFTYSEAMEDNLRRIDLETATIVGTNPQSYHVVSPQHNEDSLPASHREERTWVIFNSKVLGIYDNKRVFIPHLVVTACVLARLF